MPGQDTQDTQDTQEGVACAKRLPLAGNLPVRSTTPLAGRQLLGVLGVLGVLVAHLPMKFLAGGPSTCGRSVHLRAARPLKVAFVLYAVAQGW